MGPYDFLVELVRPDDSVLSLCCGVGFELLKLPTKNITAVDIVPEYVDALPPEVKGVVSDALDYAKKCKDKSFDVVSIIDGIEHLTKERGLELLKEAIRIAKRHVLVFTPEGYVENHPHHAWGIEAGDEYQRHLSGWTIDELKELGLTTIHRQAGVSQHGEEYHALTMRYDHV